MLRKVTLGLLALGVTASALAAHPGDVTLPAAQSGVNLTAPEQMGYWSFGVEALYFQPGGHDNNYVQTETEQDVGIVDNEYDNTHSVDNDNDWGFRADVTYHFAGYGRDATLSYTHLDSDDSDSISPIFTTDDDGVFTASGKADNDYDAVDLTFGQMIDVGTRVHLHPFAGVRYADIDVKNTAYDQFVDNEENTIDQDTDTLKSEFTGVGPRFGSDAEVTLGGGFSLVGRVGVSALIGDQDNKRTETENFYTDGGETLSSVDNEYHTQDDHTRVVPEIDARIGAKYGMNFNQGTGLAFEVGYEATDYINAVDVSSVSYWDHTTHDSDYTLQGPYVRVQLDLA